MNNLQWLMEWYKEHSDSTEPGQCISIETLDNPGWAVDISLKGTDLSTKLFPKLQIYLTDLDWIVCFVKDSYFVGRGDADRFDEILTVFKNWVNN